MNIWVQLAVWVITTIISSLLAPRAPAQAAPDPGKAEAPVAEVGRPIPVVFGEAWLRAPNVVWYGDTLADPIYSEGGGKK